MNLTVNGKLTVLDDDTTLEDLITVNSSTTRGSAAVVDGEVVPRSTWRHTRLREGQVIEIVTAVQGG